MRIAHLSAEVSPFAKTGGLGDVVGALPIAQAELGHDVTVWMPLYRQVRQELQRRGIAPEWVTAPFFVEVGFARYEVGLLRTALPGSKVPLYLLGCDRFFDRPQLYDTDIHGRDDGLLRYSVFVRATMEAMRRLHLVPDLLNAHDWHTAMAPMAIAWDHPLDWHFDRTATALTIHNLAYQGVYDRSDFVNLNLPPAALPELFWRGGVNLMKGGLLAAGAITAVSPRYAFEITTLEGGFGLDAVVRQRAGDLVGIVNGIDTKVWDPASDPKIPHHYDRNDLSGKRENRRTLLTMAGMDADNGGLVIGVVGRLVEQKGYDLLFPVLEELIRDGNRFVLLGSGEPRLEAQVRAASLRHRGRFWGFVGFDDTLAHLIEAGSDAFLMPSRFEPCGLNQLYSLAYGTPPIVRRVGGLVDTVVGYDGRNAESATGFGFDDAYPEALRETIRWVNRCHQDAELWTRLMRNGMAQDFSWHRSAARYDEVYHRLLSNR